MKYRILWIYLCFSAIVFGQNQKQALVKMDSIRFDGEEFIGYDSFGFYYTLQDDVVSKIRNSQTVEYKNISLGKITKVDLQNPLKIVLFYENFNTIVTLDNQLNETQKINLSENTFPIVATAAGLAAQNQFWIYNSLNQQLGLYDYLNQNYKTISVPFTENIKYYTSDFNQFHWIDSKNDWYQCDIFGQIKSLGPVIDFDSIVILDERQYLYSKDGNLTLVNVKNTQKIELEISEKTFTKFYYKDQILSIFTKGGITNYKITIP